MKSTQHYMVAQTGARRGYAVPALLEEAGMLESFHTDVCGNVGWGAGLVALASRLGAAGRMRLLAKRKVPEAIINKTHTYATPSLRWVLRRWLHHPNPEEDFRLHMQRVLETGDQVIRHGFGNATHLYVMYSEFPSLMREVRRRGMKVVAEVYILHSTNAILREERKLFPGWESEMPDWDAISAEMSGEDVLFTQVDHYICPSEAVSQDLTRNWGVRPEQIAVVPYGMSPAWLDLKPQPVPGRLLFAGTADLRKGIHYLAMASEELKRRGRNYEFRVAGNVTDNVRNRPQCKNLTFLGRVSRDQIQNEYEQADVFVLPTLAEGSAEVTYEAMACGLPLVTTLAAGSVARDDQEALIVPERDALALADALERLVEDRALRGRLSTAARLRAADYTWDFYGNRLINALVRFG